MFYGQNKKRRRGEIEFDDLDEQQKIYLKRREERLQNELLEEEDEDGDECDAQEREAEAKLKEAAAEEEMNEEELQNQLEQQRMFKWRRQMRIIGEEELYNRYTNLQAKQKAEDDQLDNLIVDATQSRTAVTASQAVSTHGTNSLLSSKSKQQLSTMEQTQQAAAVGGPAASRRKPVPQKLTLTVSSRVLQHPPENNCPVYP